MRVFRPTFEGVIRLYVQPQKRGSIRLHDLIKLNYLQLINRKELKL